MNAKNKCNQEQIAISHIEENKNITTSSTKLLQNFIKQMSLISFILKPQGGNKSSFLQSIFFSNKEQQQDKIIITKQERETTRLLGFGAWLACW